MTTTFIGAPLDGLCDVCATVLDPVTYIQMGARQYCKERCYVIHAKSSGYYSGPLNGFNHADAEDRRKIFFKARKWKKLLENVHRQWGIYAKIGVYRTHRQHVDSLIPEAIEIVFEKDIRHLAMGRESLGYQNGQLDTLYIDMEGTGHLLSEKDALQRQKEDLLRISNSNIPPREEKVDPLPPIEESSLPADVILEYRDTSIEERMAAFVTVMDEIFYLQGQRKEIQEALKTIKEPEFIENVAEWRRNRDEANALKESTESILDQNLAQMSDLIVRGRYLKTLLHGSDLPKEKWIKVDHRGLILKNSGDAEMLEWEKVVHPSKQVIDVDFPSPIPSILVGIAVALLSIPVTATWMVVAFTLFAAFTVAYVYHIIAMANGNTKHNIEDLHKINQELLGKVENLFEKYSRH